MAIKKTGLSHNLLIHPGETISDILEERNISQVELASLTGVTPAYISNVISGKKDISSRFAYSLDYALDIPKSFWLNLQAKYDCELLEINEINTITNEELDIIKDFGDVISYLKKNAALTPSSSDNALILLLRRLLHVSNLENLKNVTYNGSFKAIQPLNTNPYVLGAWVRLCQLSYEHARPDVPFNPNKINYLIDDIKNLMVNSNADDNIENSLKQIFASYGINFSIMQYFKNAPIYGYVSGKPDGTYELTLTIKDNHADIFWYSLLHELGHIMNGDAKRNTRFIDDGSDKRKELAADTFANNMLLSHQDYEMFINNNHFEIETIKNFASSQRVIPYVVIKRLQDDNKLNKDSYNEFNIQYQL